MDRNDAHWDTDDLLLNEIEELDVTVQVGGRPSLWLAGFAALIVAVAIVGLTGKLVAPATPVVAAAAEPAAEPATDPREAAAFALAVAPATILEPAPGARILGNLIVVRGEATRPLGRVAATLRVGGRTIGEAETTVDAAGPFTIPVPAIAAPFSTEAELVVARAGAPGSAPLARLPLELVAGPGVSVLGIGVDPTSPTLLTIDGSAPRQVEEIRVALADDRGTSIATAIAPTTPVDGWGGALLAASTFRAELPFEALDPGTILHLRVAWYDPWAEATGSASITLVVPQPPRLTAVTELPPPSEK